MGIYTGAEAAGKAAALAAKEFRGGDEMDCKNYILLEKPSFRYQYVCYIDTKGYLADAIFIKHKIRVWFLKDACKPDADYIFVICKVKKGDINAFLEAMQELENKMILLGRSDYQTFCQWVQNDLLEQKKKA